MFIQLAGVKNGPADERTANQIAGDTRLWFGHAPSVDAFKAVWMQVLHFKVVPACSGGVCSKAEPCSQIQRIKNRLSETLTVMFILKTFSHCVTIQQTQMY